MPQNCTLKMVKVVNFMLYIFCHSQKKKRKRKKENFGVNLNDLGFGKGFLGMMPKAQPTKGNRYTGLHQN